MSKALLVLNTGSSSVKFRLFACQKNLPLLGGGKVSGLGTAPAFTPIQTKKTVKLPRASKHEDALRFIMRWIQDNHHGETIIAAGHRVVHGGNAFVTPVPVNQSILKKLRTLTPLAPLHQPHNLAGIDILAKLNPDLKQIACFDTAFHAGQEDLYSSYALPKTLRDQGVRRYGFHGLSYEWVVETVRRDDPALAKRKIIAAHLGNGASLCAIRNGKSVDTTMGMTALDGLPMGTRCGSLDPGAVLYLVQELGYAPREIERLLYEESGLKGLSGISNDVKTLLASRAPRARFALDYFVLRVARCAAMMAASMGGADAIVFTGGIGENAPSIRRAILKRLAFLGLLRSLVISCNEEQIIARHTLSCVNRRA